MAANTSIIMRIELDKTRGSFAQIAGVIAQSGGDIVAVDVIRSGKQSTIRDITVDLQGLSATYISDAVKAVPGIQLINISDPTFLAHLGGKIEIMPKMPIKTRDDLS